MAKRTDKSSARQDRNDSYAIRLLEKGGVWKTLLSFLANKDECKAKQVAPTGMQKTRNVLSVAAIWEMVRDWIF